MRLSTRRAAVIRRRAAKRVLTQKNQRAQTPYRDRYAEPGIGRERRRGLGERPRNALAPTMDAALAKHPQISLLYADGGYAGQIADAWSSAHAVDVSITPSTARACTGPQAELFGSPPTPPGGGLYDGWSTARMPGRSACDA